jgi:hypothetical protein
MRFRGNRQLKQPANAMKQLAALVVAVVLGVAAFPAGQAPVAARLTGEAPPPSSDLSLWYRTPA